MEYFGAILYCVQECVRIVGFQCSPALPSERLCPGCERWRKTAVFSKNGKRTAFVIDAGILPPMRRYVSHVSLHRLYVLHLEAASRLL
jgi:hypothetical protein